MLTLFREHWKRKENEKDKEGEKTARERGGVMISGTIRLILLGSRALACVDKPSGRIA